MERTSQRWAGRAVVLLLTLLGLVAMHGLPDAMAGSGGAPSMTAGAAIPPRVVTPMTMGAQALPPMRVGTEAGPAARAGSVPIGCAMDHSQCVAVLRDTGHLSAPASALSDSPELGAARSSPTAPMARGPRAPPNVSLTILGISRT